MTDGDLVRRVLSGDPEAFGQLVERWHPPCLRYARRWCGSTETAEEVVQDAFLRVHASLERYVEQDQFRAWLYRILINRCRTATARMRRRESLVTPMDPLPEAAAAGSAGADVLRRARIDAALQRIDPDRREAFLLKHLEELSYEEMAELTGASVPALKMRVMRAREDLQRLLGDGHDR